MVAHWSRLFPNGFGDRLVRAGGVAAIKGNIGAIPPFAALWFFRRSD
jgi:hypothetical protein